MSNCNYKILSIEGNIGSGKSTLLKNIKDKYESNHNIIFLREPVDEWDKIRDKNGSTMLQKFYSNQEKYSFAFQMMAYISRLKILKDAIDSIKDKPGQYIIITERSLYTDKYVFAKMLYDQGKIEDVCFQIYNNWFEEFSKNYTIDTIVYVKTEPQICYERIHKRNRTGEETIPLSYLNECNEYHDNFVNNFNNKNNDNNNNLLIDGNIDITLYPDELNNWLKKIDELLFMDI